MDVKSLRFCVLFALVITATVFATSSASDTVAEHEVMVSPSSAGTHPTIASFNVILFNGKLYIWGNVTDPDNDVFGRTVFMTGSFTRSMTIGADGIFGVVIPTNQTLGSVNAVAIDAEGNISPRVYGDFQL